MLKSNVTTIELLFFHHVRLNVSILSAMQIKYVKTHVYCVAPFKIFT